jgi:multidrug resistance efflux pump
MNVPTASAMDNPATQPVPPELVPIKVTDLGPVNGAAPAIPSRLAQPLRWSLRTKVIAVAGLLLLAAIGSGAYLFFRNPFSGNRVDLVTHKVRSERLELTIVERGALESAKNSDIYCTVKAGQKGGTIASTIKWVIDDGSSVKKGDLLVELDSSGLEEQLKTQKITVDGAEANKVSAEENFKIVDSQNKSDIATAQVVLELAEIDLEKYLKGDYPQALKDVLGRIEVAKGDMEQQLERTAWAGRMVKKGYYTTTQAQAEQSKLDSCKLALAKVQEEERVLNDQKYGLKKRTETDLGNKVAEAKRALDRVKSQAKAKEVQAQSDRETKKSIYQQEMTRYKEIEDEIKKCKIFAPQDGMVVYFVPEQARFGGGSQQSIVAQGEPVREGQKLMQIPNLRRMLVNTKVHEALVSRVKTGQPARIRVDSFPDKALTGHVDSVATVSSQQDFMSADVKVYTTKVRIDDRVEGLKPGMSAEVRVTVGAALENVLTVPVQAIVGGAELGKQRKCFVLTPQGPVARDIVVGESNEKMAEVKEGLQEGEEVVLNPRALVGDKAKTREAGGNRKGETPDAKPVEGNKGKERPVQDKQPGAGKTPMGEGPMGGGAGQFSAEDRQKQMEKFRQASAAERKQMLEQIPEAFRDKVKERLKEEGIEIK